MPDRPLPRAAPAAGSRPPRRCSGESSGAAASRADAPSCSAPSVSSLDDSWFWALGFLCDERAARLRLEKRAPARAGCRIMGPPAGTTLLSIGASERLLAAEAPPWEPRGAALGSSASRPWTLAPDAPAGTRPAGPGNRRASRAKRSRCSALPRRGPPPGCEIARATEPRSTRAHCRVYEPGAGEPGMASIASAISQVCHSRLFSCSCRATHSATRASRSGARTTACCRRATRISSTRGSTCSAPNAPRDCVVTDGCRRRIDARGLRISRGCAS